MRGKVVHTFNRFYKVKNEDGEWLCIVKGNFRKVKDEYRLPVIGDAVQFQLGDEKDGIEGFISEIEPRTNALARYGGDFRRPKTMAANLDRVLVVTGMIKPGIDWGLIDRYVMACELEEIPVSLVFNKIELDPDNGSGIPTDLYEQLEIPVFFTSVKTGRGLKELSEAIAGKTVFLTGASGVGKSSLINALAPHADLTIGQVDKKRGQGRHTTTFSVLIPTVCGGYLVDSPGLRDFVPPMVPPESVRYGFKEMADLQEKCRFGNCLHDREPGCAVKSGVKNGTVSSSRYAHYLALLVEMRQWAEKRFE